MQDTKIELQQINIPQPITLRQFAVEVKKLQTILRQQKKKLGLSTGEIAERLGVPTTKVEHWFRTDGSFAIPDATVWSQLAELLQIDDTDLDKQITTFEEQEGTFEKSERHYLDSGLAPTIMAGTNDKIIVSLRGRDAECPTSRRKSDNLKQRLEIQQNGELCGVLTTFQKDNMVLEPQLVGGLGEKNSNGGTQYYQQDRVYNSNGIAMAHPAQIPEGSYKYMVEEKKFHQQDLVQSDEGVSRTLVAGSHGNAGTYTKTMTNYRIRKLTPKECFRLMGVKDEDFEKLTVSNSQLYKQAGNSIVVDVLEAIFENMFIKECKSNSLF